MTEYFTKSERRCCAILAANLQCNFDSVLASFKKHRVYEAVDGLDKLSLDLDIECLERAWKHTNKAIESLAKLSEISTNKKLETGVLISLDAGELGRKIEIVLKLHKSIRRENSAKGGLNYKALYMARMVADLFNKLGKKITFGKSPEGEPTTEYCRTVQNAFTVFDVRTTQINRDRKSLDTQLPIADWQGPCERVWKEWESKG